MSPLGITLGVLARSWSGYYPVPPPAGGLLMNLDGADPSSYPGTGTTWFDLSGNGYDWTFVGPFSFSSGVFNLSGTAGPYPGITRIEKNFGSVPAFGAGPLTFFVRAKTLDPNAVTLCSSTTSTYAGAYSSTNGFYHTNAGSPYLYVDGVASTDLFADFADGSWHVVEIGNLDLSHVAWSAYMFNAYSFSGFNFSTVEISNLLMYDKNLTAPERAALIASLP